MPFKLNDCGYLLGKKLGLSNKGWPSQIWLKLISKPHPKMPLCCSGELTDTLQNNHRDFSNSSTSTLEAVSSSDLRQLGAY